MRSEEATSEPMIGRWHVGQHPQYKFWCVMRVNHGGGVSSKSAQLKEEAEAVYAAMAAKGACRECGDVLDDSFMEPYKTKIREQRLCFSCLFWQDYVGKVADPASVRVRSHHYWILPDGKPDLGSFYGHGGAEFVIQFADGREVVSRNLWSQGLIPPHYRERLADNAEFIARGHRVVGNLTGQRGYVGPGSADGALHR